MTLFDWIQLLFLVGLLILLTPLLGTYMYHLFFEDKVSEIARKIEEFSYKVGDIDPKREMTWQQYAKALFLFNLLGFFALFFLQIAQYYLPLNPQEFPGVPWLLALNTSVSFVTNTNWQAYAGETTMSYMTQLVGLAVQNFLSAATGTAALMVLIRGFMRKNSATVGNFWVDLMRAVLFLLVPLALLLAITLAFEGVVQTVSPYVTVNTLENGTQTIPLGPAASQVAIKQLGTNGGGFFNANSAHPFENPTALTNFLELFAILLIPAALTYTYGLAIGSKRHGWLLFSLMLFFWLSAMLFAFYAESRPNPIVDALPNMEGKETRFGMANSIMWAVSTTDTANGSVNAMLSSLSPLAGGIALFNIMLGELVFGGVGAGLSNMIMYVLLTVFLAGLMVGRTPEYLGKKIEKQEIQWVMVSVLFPGILILIGSALSCMIPAGVSSLKNHGPHGLTEILYAFSSTAGNNGSAFAGLEANTPYYNTILSMMMAIGRIAVVLPSIAIGGILAAKKMIPQSLGTFSVTTPLFVILLGCVILIVGVLTFFPALCLGPIAEHLLMLQQRTF